MFQSCLQDDDVATVETNLVRGGVSVIQIGAYCNLQNILFGGLHNGGGLWRYLATVSVPSLDSSILHCWTIDML